MLTSITKKGSRRRHFDAPVPVPFLCKNGTHEHLTYDIQLCLSESFPVDREAIILRIITILNNTGKLSNRYSFIFDKVYSVQLVFTEHKISLVEVNEMWTFLDACFMSPSACFTVAGKECIFMQVLWPFLHSVSSMSPTESSLITPRTTSRTLTCGGRIQLTVGDVWRIESVLETKSKCLKR